jgi:hypothetical protein
MKLDAIQAIARQHGIKPGKNKKSELIRSIQSAESNEQCYESGKAEKCGQDACLWRSLCR